MEQSSDMYGQTRLHKRGSIYYFRAMVPKDLRTHFGKREIVYSLRTKDRAEATRLVRRASVELDEQFERVRAEQAGRPATLSHLNDEVIETLCERWRHNALSGDAWGRSQGLSDAEYEEQHAQRAATLDTLKEALAKGRLERIEPALRAFLHLNGIEFVADGETQRRLAYAFLQTVTETHQAQLARDQGEVVRTPPAPPPLSAVQIDEGPESANGSKVLSIGALVDRWQALVPDRPAETVASFRRVAKAFVAHCGKNRIDQVTRGDVFAYRDHLLIEQRRHYGTVSKNLSYLSALFQVAVDAELIPGNPASRIKVPKPKVKKRSRLPYNTEHLNAIFRCPIYTEGERPRGGGGEAAAWLPLLATFTGCRLEELSQLTLSDVCCKQGVHYLSITDLENGEGKNVKSESSRRDIPLHPQLVKSGFLRYVESRKSKVTGNGMLFPDLRRDVKGKVSGNWSKWWGRYARKVIGINDRRRVFHSFRHAFRDACLDADLKDELIDVLMGHADTRTGRQYGESYSLKKRYWGICQIQYPEVAFPMVVPAQAQQA